MNANTLFPIGLVVAAIVMGLSAATTPIIEFDLWLDSRDAPVTAQANALSPVIACINRVDVHWRLAYDRYKHPEPEPVPIGKWFADRQEFADADLFNVQELQRDVCLSGMDAKLGLLAYRPALAQKARDYADALHRAAAWAPTNRFDSKPEFPSDAGQYAAQIQTAADDYASASATLRADVLTLDKAQRPEQLKRLEQRVGKDIHWHLLAYMIQARDTLDRLDDGMKHRTLTPQAVADTTADLQQAWDRRKPFLGLRGPGFRNKDDDARELWERIDAPAQKYLNALNTLHKDWRERAAPQRLSDDYYAVNRSYDALLSHYNRQARASF
ncbi:DUF3829 domain-containing protein [Pseudomonas sp. NPDC089534]|uniref:DUF3829 domain-containing protein n=1 Tax=Pseudomonas sp. NPDC089534 TaxID=3364468 RepID=UPI00382D836E